MSRSTVVKQEIVARNGDRGVVKKAGQCVRLRLKSPLNAMWFINAENNQKHLKILNWSSENEVNECSFLN